MVNTGDEESIRGRREPDEGSPDNLALHLNRLHLEGSNQQSSTQEPMEQEEDEWCLDVDRLNQEEEDDPIPDMDAVDWEEPPTPAPRYQLRSRQGADNSQEDPPSDSDDSVEMLDSQGEEEDQETNSDPHRNKDITRDSMMTMRGEVDVSAREELDDADTAGVELLSILLKANAPLRLYSTVLEWGRNQSKQNLESVRTRKHVVEKVVNRYNHNHLISYEKPCYLPHLQQEVNITCHSFVACLMSLLENEELMRKENLLFDLEDPSKFPDLATINGPKGEVDTGSAYVEGWHKICTKDGKDVMIPIILFIDGTFVDARGRHQLEPVCFTLGCFDYETRCKPEAWRTLGFIKKNITVDSNITLEQILGDKILKKDAPSTMQQQPSRKDLPKVPPGTNGNLVDYHAMLSVILEDLYSVQQLEDGLQWSFKRGQEVGENDNFNIKCPILFIMGDTMGHNKLAGLKNGASTENPQCRLCTLPKDQMDDPTAQADKTTRDKFDENHQPLDSGLGHHKLENNILRKMLYCDDHYGLNGALVPEALHFLLLGYFPYAINGLSRRKRIMDPEVPTYSTNYVFPPKDQPVINETCRTIGYKLQRQSDRSLPRTHFPSGYLPKLSNKKDQKTSKKCGHEMPGVILCLLLFLLMDANYHHYEPPMSENDLNAYLQAFEILLLMDQWMKQESFSQEELTLAGDFIPKMMTSYKAAVDRQTGNGMKIIKFHLMTHVVDTIQRFGAIRNVYGGVGETMLKYKVKQTGRRTVMSAKTFESHTTMRDVEAVSIERAAFDVANSREDSILRKLHPSFRKKDVAYNDILEEPETQADQEEQEEEPIMEDEDDLHVGTQKSRKYRGRPIYLRWKKGVKGIKPKNAKWSDYQKTWKGELLMDEFLTLLDFLPVKRENHIVTFHTEVAKEGNLYRANPNYMGAPWQDWAVCNFQGRKLPCQLLLYFHIERVDEERQPVPVETMAGIGSNRNDLDRQLLEQFSKVDRAGKYAIVHYCRWNCMEDPSEDEEPVQIYNYDKDFTSLEHRLVNPNCPIARWCVKDCNIIHYKKRKFTKSELLFARPHIGIIKANDILEPLIGVQDMAGRYPFQYIFLENHNKWGSFLVDRMREAQHTDLNMAGMDTVNERDIESLARRLREEEDGLEEESDTEDFVLTCLGNRVPVGHSLTGTGGTVKR